MVLSCKHKETHEFVYKRNITYPVIRIIELFEDIHLILYQLILSQFTNLFSTFFSLTPKYSPTDILSL